MKKLDWKNDQFPVSAMVEYVSSDTRGRIRSSRDNHAAADDAVGALHWSKAGLLPSLRPPPPPQLCYRTSTMARVEPAT